MIDARGIDIQPGDTVIYGYDDARRVALAEGVVVRQERRQAPSVTPSGRVRVRVTWRSHGMGTKPVVDVDPARLIVLKSCAWEPFCRKHPYLPNPTGVADEEVQKAG